MNQNGTNLNVSVFYPNDSIFNYTTEADQRCQAGTRNYYAITLYIKRTVSGNFNYMIVSYEISGFHQSMPHSPVYHIKFFY